MVDISMERTEAPPEEAARMKEFAEKNGFAMGSLSFTIHEETVVSDARDAAITSAAGLLKVIEQLTSSERTLRDKLAKTNQAFYDERRGRTDDMMKAAQESGEIQRRARALEKQVGLLQTVILNAGMDLEVELKKLDQPPRQPRRRAGHHGPAKRR